MKDKEKAAFLVYLTTAAEALDGKMNEIKGEIYFEALKDLSLEEVKQGISTCVKTSHFFPKPVEIRESIHGKPEDQALEAWEKLLDAIRSTVGAERSVIFEDSAITHFVIGEGGWIKICSKTSEELKWLKKDFVKAYAGLKMRPAILQKLTGLHEDQNSHWHDAPKYLAIVGDAERVRALMGMEKPKLVSGK